MALTETCSIRRRPFHVQKPAIGSNSPEQMENNNLEAAECGAGPLQAFWSKEPPSVRGYCAPDCIICEVILPEIHLDSPPDPKTICS